MSIPSDPKAMQKGSSQKRDSEFLPPPSHFPYKHSDASEIPNKRTRHDDSWRPDTSQQTQQQIQSPTQKNCIISNQRPSSSSSSSPLSLDACVQNMIKKEMHKIFYDNNKLREEMKSKIDNVKNMIENLQDQQKIINEKIAVTNKSESGIKANVGIPPSLEDRINRIEKNVAELQVQVNKIVETLSNPETKIEERIAAVVEEKLEQRKEITVSKDPKWFIKENKCKELYNYSQGQVARFLADYLPILYDLPGIISPFKSDEKGEEARAVIDHFWNGTLTTDLCIKEIEKEHANQRYKISRKIYQALKNSAGCIMSKTGTIYECNWDEEKRKFIPKIGEFEILRPQKDDDESIKIKKVQFEWSIPKDIYKEKFVKNDYMIVAKNDDLNQTRISKIDLETLEMQMLYTKRKYGSN